MTPPRGLLLRTSSPTETREAAAALAGVLRVGDVVSLTGELGAGKTCFVQGVAAGLGIERRVTSPTFMLLRSYDDGSIPLVHVDVYRLDRLQDVLELGDEVMAPDRLTLVEWGDAIAPLLPDDRLQVEIVLETDELDSDRLLHVTPLGGWDDRVGALEAACSQWWNGRSG